MSVLEHILHNNPKDRTDVAFVDAENPSRRLTWQESVDSIQRVARGLVKDIHVKPGECVALVSRNDIYYSILVLGIAAMGGICIGLPPQSTSAELERYIVTCGATWIFTEAEFRKTVLDAASRVGISESQVLDFDVQAPYGGNNGPVTFSSLLTLNADDIYDLPSISSTQTCCRILTSGTTGWPKAADISHQAVIARGLCLYGSDTTYCALHCAPMYHASVIFMFMSTMMGSQTTYVSRTTEPTAIVDSIHAHQISAMTASAKLAELIAAVIDSGSRPKECLKSLRSYVCGGSMITQQNFDTLKAVLPVEASFQPAYGSTEAGFVFAPKSGSKVDPKFVGSLVPDTIEIRIINPATLRDVDKDEEGELVVRGVQVFSSYHNNPEDNKSSHFTDASGQWFRTGDKILFDSAREQYSITGRYKEIFKVFDGKEVSPVEVEEALKTHKCVIDAAVTARPGREGDGYSEPMAYVVCSKMVSHEVTAQELANHVAKSLSAYKAPTGVQLRTAVHILVRRVQQLSKVIIEADREIPPLDAEDEDFLERVLGTLGLSDAPPYESSAAKNGKPLQRFPSNQTTSTPEAPQQTQVAPSAPVENDSALVNVVSTDTPVSGQYYQPDFNNVTGMMPGMHAQVTTQSPGTNIIPGADHISPDWPFPTLDNMLNFDLFDPSDLSLQFLTEPSADMPHPTTIQQESTPVRQIEQTAHQQEDSTSNSGDEENTELVNQLSARLGSLRLAPDGKLRYFGTASNLHLIDNQSKSGENFMLHTPSRVNVQRLLEVVDLSQTVDIQLEDHLLRLFFTWHNPSSYIVDEEVFYMARQSWFNTGVQNSYYNDVLKDAMCAIGASFGNHSNMSLITYPRSMPQFFSDRAKILLDSHLDSPCVATAQALVILASYEESCQNIARGWLFGGMAMRIAFDLGLHIDSAGYVAQGILTVAEARARQVAFWGCYLSNLLWSFHLGRPFSLDDSEVTVPKPDPKTLPSNPTWQPYSIPSLQFVPGAMHDASQLPDITPQIFHHWIFLCQNIAVVGHALYSYTSISKPALQELCEETTTELFHWKDSLPPHLQIDTSDTATVKLPQLLMLHMEYHHLQIFLHRPWTSSQLQPQPLQGAGVHHARHVCATSATEIARLLRIYENQYTFRFINVEIIRILSSAALILIFATVPLPHREIDVEMTGYLNTCFRALEDLGGRYDSAKETRCTLLAIQRRWNDLYGRNTGQKRGPSMRGSTSQGKRVRAAPL
ncbi:hypothetical protein KCU91_g5449, partial [Aureobasidium melanogenum]